MRLQLLALLGSIASLALADVEFVTPAAGASIPAGAITVTFKESGTAPLITTFSSYQLFLVAGGNDANIVSSIRTFEDGTRLIAA